jgi:CHAT domain-containing protein
MSRGAQRPAGLPSLVILLLVAGTTLLPVHAVAGSVRQPPLPQASVADRLKEADRLAAEHRGAEARSLYIAAAEQARAESRVDLEAQAFESLGRLLNGDSQYAEAQTFLERALPLAESIPDLPAVARIQTSLGNVAVNRGRYADADALYRKAASAAEKAGEQRLLASALLNLCLLDMTPAAERDQLREKVVAIARSIGDTDLEARVWHSRGDWHFADGSFALALEELQTAATLYEKAGNDDGLASVYTSLGRVSRMHGLALDAIPYYQRAFEIQRKEDDKIGMVQSLNATGVAYGTAGDNDKALTYYERAYALAVESQSARAIAFMKGNLAGGLIKLGQYARAAELLESLLEDGGDNYPSVRHSQLSIAYVHMNRLEQARANADKAVAMAGGTQVIQALVRRAQVRGRQADPAGALEDLLRAADLIEQVRQKLVPLDFMKQGFTTQYLEVYSGMIAIYQGRGEAGRAIEVAESARARAFLDLLASRAILAPKAAKPSDIAQLSATAARTRSTILTYWTTEDELFIGVVPVAGPPQMARVAVASKRLAALVASVAPTPAVSAVPATQAAASWKALYRSLIEPVRQWLPAPGGHLTIIPEGPLMRLPFAALATAGGRYLIEDYSLSYAPAGAFLDAGAGRPVAPPAERRFLFVADPRLPPPARGESALPPLPGARAEVRAITRLVPASMTTVLANEKASKPAVTGRMPDASVLHFATHGIVNDRAPLDSYLALGLPEPPVGDGRLTAQELYGLHLRADLVVLSSCRSAGGQVTGEGISALARAFLSAGVPAVVASVWDVPDQPSNRLFPVLYTSWLHGASPARALRAAQLRLIADLRAGKVGVATVAGEVRLTETPSLWAGFIVIGGR